MLRFHLDHNLFYKELAKVNSLKMEDVPVLTKQNLQIPLKSRLSKGFQQTTVLLIKPLVRGTPFSFTKDKYTHALTWASNMYRFGWFGIDFNSSYQARFYGIPLDFIGYKKRTIQRFLGQTVSVSNFNLSDSVLENLKKSTEKFDYINGYTSSIVLLLSIYASNLILKLFVLP
jgi:phenylacetate-CoA ligase